MCPLPGCIMRNKHVPNVSIKAINLPQVRVRMGKIHAKLKNIEPTHKKISIMLDRWVQENFKTEGGNVGGWAPLKAGGRFTGKGKNRKFDPSAKILRNTTRLSKSFLPFADKKDAGIGSDLPYSKPHDEGIGIVMRRILPVLPEVKRDINNAYNDHVKEAIR